MSAHFPVALAVRWGWCGQLSWHAPWEFIEPGSLVPPYFHITVTLEARGCSHKGVEGGLPASDSDGPEVSFYVTVSL